MASSTVPKLPNLRPELANYLITNGLRCPAVIRHMTDGWQCRHWDLNEWANKFEKKPLKFRVGPIHSPESTGPLWETECDYVTATVAEFVSWQRPKEDDGSSRSVHDITQKCPETSSQLSKVDRSQSWVYADYKHMAELFDTSNDIHKCIDWDVFGFQERDGKQSTIWIGSASSHTPCHYDTYGFNLVAQLYGRKQWVLFPPNDTENLYPTRFPYEESSVFSQVNLTNPDNEKFPDFKLSTPYVVTLEPGDVLYVPHQWWHYVTSLSTTISVNSWIEWVEDSDRRLEEAVTRTMVSAFMETYSLSRLEWLNPTECEIFPDDNIRFVRESLERCHKAISSLSGDQSISGNFVYDTVTDSEASDSMFKKRKVCLDVDNILKEHKDTIKLVEKISFRRFTEIMDHRYRKQNPQKKLPDEDNLQIALFNALLDPEVISLICKKLKSSTNREKLLSP